MGERKIVQISAAGYGGDYNQNSVVYALCADGSVWICYNGWTQLPPIPQNAAATAREGA